MLIFELEKGWLQFQLFLLQLWIQPWQDITAQICGAIKQLCASHTPCNAAVLVKTGTADNYWAKWFVFAFGIPPDSNPHSNSNFSMCAAEASTTLQLQQSIL